MRVPSEAPKVQSVEIRPMQSIASSMEVNFASVAVTKQVKPEESMYQAATKVNVLSPVISCVVGVEVVHKNRRQHVRIRLGESAVSYRGLRQWHDARWILGELGRSNDFFPFMESMRGQALKGEEWQINRWKSDLLIVLGVRERRIQGEAVSNENALFSEWSSDTLRSNK
jgi:hypothetical protein